MYKALISLVMILVMSASIGSGVPVELEVVAEEAVAANMAESDMFGMSFAHADQWQLVIANNIDEHCDL